MNFLVIFTLVLAGMSILSGCNPGDDNIEPDDNGFAEWPDGLDVYVAGFEEITQGNPAARLWKNGEVQTFAGNSGAVARLSRTAIISSEARSVFVSGGDAYVAGWDIIVTGDNWYISGEQVITNGDEVISHARLWKNGEAQHLDGGTLSDQAISVFVSGEDVFVLGREALQSTPFPGRWAFKVWKNGEVQVFYEGLSNNCQVSSLFVSDGNVYVAGSRTTQSGSQATLWKNGVAVELANESPFSYANFVFISGNDVHVAGYARNNYLVQGTNVIASDALVWKNGDVEKLTNGPQNSQAHSIYVSDAGDVYVAGYDGDNAKLWKNGIVQDIIDDKDAKMYLSVFQKDDDLYLAGYVNATQAVPPGSGIIPLTYYKATLWKNGKRLNLKVGERNSRAFSVFVE